jgi:hypothetical protein
MARVAHDADETQPTEPEICHVEFDETFLEQIELALYQSLLELGCGTLPPRSDAERFLKSELNRLIREVIERNWMVARVITSNARFRDAWARRMFDNRHAQR